MRRPSRLRPLALPVLVLLACLARADAPRPVAVAARPGSRRPLAGLAAPARIVTDRWGVTHVRAASLPDLYLAWGYATGRDRLWQLALVRAQAQGLTHRWFGNDALLADGGAQLFRLRERADAIWARDQSDPALRSALEHYAAGINAAIAERFAPGAARGRRDEFDRLGIRMAPWRPQDTVLLLLGYGITLDLDLPEFAEAHAIGEHGAAWLEARRRFEAGGVYTTIPGTGRPDDSLRADAVRRPDDTLPSGTLAALARAFPPRDGDGADRASNEFVIGPGRSTSGKPILGNDPHLHLTTPGPFHVVHLEIPGLLDAVGAEAPGLPTLASGRNRRCAWGVTALSVDMVDVYRDSLSADGRSILTPGGPVPVVTRPFDLRYSVLGIRVPVPSFVQQRRYTPHGPVLVWDPKHHRALSARWSAMEDERITLRRLVGIEQSRSAAEVTARWRTLVTPGFNVVAADVDGAALYQTCGLVPRRPFPFTRGVLPSDGRHEWAGFVDPDSMPAWRLPADGFAVNANNLPAANMGWRRFDWWQDRAARMAQRFAGDRSVTADDAISVQNDVVSRAAERAVPLLLACADSLRGTLGPRERAALDTLRAWDHVARRDRTAPTIYRAWWATLVRRGGVEGLPGLALAALASRAPGALTDPRTHAPVTPARAAIEALPLALDTLAARLGADPHRWTWGRAHLARFEHPFTDAFHEPGWEPPLTAEDGDGSTVAVGASSMPWDLRVTHGPAFRHVVDLADTTRSWGVVAPWNSAATPVDLRATWARHGVVPFLLDFAAAERAAVATIDLTPASH